MGGMRRRWGADVIAIVVSVTITSGCTEPTPESEQAVRMEMSSEYVDDIRPCLNDIAYYMSSMQNPAVGVDEIAPRQVCRDSTKWAGKCDYMRKELRYYTEEMRMTFMRAKAYQGAGASIETYAVAVATASDNASNAMKNIIDYLKINRCVPGDSQRHAAEITLDELYIKPPSFSNDDYIDQREAPRNVTIGCPETFKIAQQYVTEGNFAVYRDMEESSWRCASGLAHYAFDLRAESSPCATLAENLRAGPKAAHGVALNYRFSKQDRRIDPLATQAQVQRHLSEFNKGYDELVQCVATMNSGEKPSS